MVLFIPQSLLWVPHNNWICKTERCCQFIAHAHRKSTRIFSYDFVCLLDEFVKNRVSAFLENYTFFQDIFDGCTHKCSDIFQSNRLLGFKGLNTSVCKQFDSLIQCIKASSKLMTQEHYTFYMQLFIKQWNAQRRTMNWEK